MSSSQPAHSPKAQFGELRSLLQQRPSKGLWELITGLLWRWAMQQDREALESLALPYAHQHLERWPQHLRVAPKTWLEAIDAQDPRLSLAMFSLCAIVDHRFWLYDRLDCAQVARLLAQRPYGQHVRGLWLDSSLPLALDGIFTALKSGPHLNSLDKLAVGLPPSHISIARNDAPAQAARLSHLWLKRGRLSLVRLDDWLRCLCPTEAALDGALTHLCLIEQELESDARELERLMRWPRWSRLHKLHLFGCFVDGHADRFLRVLLETHERLELEVLDLGGNQLTDRAVAALARTDGLAKLEVLALHLNTISASGLDALWRSDQLERLRTLFVPSQLVDARQQDRFAQRGVSLIGLDDPRPLADQAEQWF